MKSISFSAGGSNSFHKLELSRSLLHFTEFDFTYFWEQSIETGRNARKTGRISRNIAALAENAVMKCHPYVEACMQTEFSSVVLDCIIAYICHSEGIGLEELWARCISPKSMYEKSIFKRISEYKTGRGINQWINIVRIQEYARSKLAFIYETENNIMLTPAEYRTRREYFDLAFTVAANETGCDMTQVPCVKKYTPSLMPEAAFMMGKVSKNIYRRLSDVLSKAEPVQKRPQNDHIRDQAALDAFSYVKDMPRPAEIDMRFAIESITAMPETVYVPDSFKAIIDLEFTCMSEEGIYMSKCPRCGRFFVRDINERSPYCDRITGAGKTCSQLINEEIGNAVTRRAADSAAHAEEADKTEESAVITAEAPAESESTAEGIFVEEVYPVLNAEPSDEITESAAPEPKAEAVQKEEHSDEGVPREIPHETEKRCQKVYNMLYKRIGRIMTDTEFKEWSRYLSDMKRNVRIGEATLSQLEDFLGFWETEIKKPRPKKKHTEEPADKAQKSEEKNYPQPEQSSFFDAAVAEYESREAKREEADISPENSEAHSPDVVFKPFNPPKYNTVLEAMMDGKYKSDELLSEKGSVSDDDLDEIKVKGRKITVPNWEKIQRKP
ncbi:MAG: hypothetical protein ACI4JJ_08985 [Huintestinicola sp.]